MLAEYNARMIDKYGSYQRHQLPEGDADQLKALQDAVDGWVEVHQLPGHLAVWMDEDARRKGTRRNLVAERIVKALGVELHGGILGAVVITGRDDAGEVLPLTPEQVATLDSSVQADES